MMEPTEHVHKRAHQCIPLGHQPLFQATTGISKDVSDREDSTVIPAQRLMTLVQQQCLDVVPVTQNSRRASKTETLQR